MIYCHNPPVGCQPVDLGGVKGLIAVMNTYPSAKQLRQAAKIQDKIEALQVKLNRALTGPLATTAPRTRRGMSAAGRARIAAAQRARWAKQRGARRLTAAVRGKR